MNGNVNVFPNKIFKREWIDMSTLSFAGPRFTTKNLTLAAMLVALQVILNKLSIGDPAVLKFSFGSPRSYLLPLLFMIKLPLFLHISQLLYHNRFIFPIAFI